MNNSMVINLKKSLLILNCVLAICVPFACTGPVTTGAGLPDKLVLQAHEIIRSALADYDPQIRVKAIEVVADTRQVEFITTVQRLLTDDFIPVRFVAALAIGDMKYYPAGPMIEKLLDAPDENTRLAAAYALANLGRADNVTVLRQALNSTDQTARANAALLLGRIGDKGSLQSLYKVMTDKDAPDKVAFQAAEAIASLGDENIYPKLWTMLISAYADVRTMGVKAMGALGTRKAAGALITMLDDDILEVRLAAAEQLGMLGSAAGQPEVLDVFTKNLTAQLTTQDRQRVNVLAALAVGQIRTPLLTRFLPRLLKDRSKLVRIAAAKAVFQLKIPSMLPRMP